MDADAATRNSARTKRQILDVAARLFTEKGSGVPISEIAAEAGVSKSGLLHHFSNRDALLLAVARDSLDGFRADVLSFVDLSENIPGKMIRAFVRALCGGSQSAMHFFGYSALWGTLDNIPGISELLASDAQYWKTAFSEDGLHPDRILVIRRAAEGLAAASLYDADITTEQVTQARLVLLAMAADNSPLT